MGVGPGQGGHGSLSAPREIPPFLRNSAPGPSSRSSLTEEGGEVQLGDGEEERKYGLDKKISSAILVGLGEFKDI